MTPTTRALLGLGCWLGLGCAHPQETQGPEGFAPRYKLTVVSASIADRDPSGEAWHREEPSGLLSVLGFLAGWSFGGPAGAAIGGEIGAIVEGGERLYPPAAVVEVRVGGELFETYDLASFSPRWDYSFALDLREHSPDTPFHIIVRDADGGRVLGEMPEPLPLRTLLDSRGGLFRLGESVSVVQLKVQPLPLDAEPARYAFTVPGDRSLEALAEGEARAPAREKAWRRIPVLNGDVVTVRAKGEVCPGSWYASECVGPGGTDSVSEWQSYNRREFRGFAHAGLVGFYADQPVFLGQGATFVAKRPGYLLLGVNDKDLGNNTGDFEVTVEVRAPR